MSDFARMNDPGEYHYARKCYLEARHSNLAFIDGVPRLLATFALLELEASTVMFIACFSEEPDDPHQWQRYGDDGRGCVIGFDASYLAEKAGVTVRRIVYHRDAIDAFVGAGLTMLQTEYEKNPDDRDGITELARFFSADLFAFKHPDFAAEGEVRISRLLLRDDVPGPGVYDGGGHCIDGTPLPALPVHERQGAHGPTRYVALPLARDGQTAIRSLTFGAAVDDAEIVAFSHPAGRARCGTERSRPTL